MQYFAKTVRRLIFIQSIQRPEYFNLVEYFDREENSVRSLTLIYK